MKINIGCYNYGEQKGGNIQKYDIKVKVKDFTKLKISDIRAIVDKERGTDYSILGWCASFKRTQNKIARM